MKLVIYLLVYGLRFEDVVHRAGRVLVMYTGRAVLVMYTGWAVLVMYTGWVVLVMYTGQVSQGMLCRAGFTGSVMQYRHSKEHLATDL